MSLHTPGPWRIELETQHDCGYSRSSSAIVGADFSPVVLFDPSEGEYSCALDPNSADARLIAAAPELLECLQFVVDHHEPAVANLLFGEGWVEHARNAIAKATGDQP